MSKKNFERFLVIISISILTLFIINAFLFDSSPQKDQINNFSGFNEGSHKLMSSDTWIPNDTVICNAINDQEMLQICSDGAGGVINVWEDNRSGTDRDIYVQRINSTGDVQWTLNGVEVCTANFIQYDPQIYSDGVGGAIITWTDQRAGNSDIYAQRINSYGIVLWRNNGIVISNATDSQYNPTICDDGNGGAIISWMDSRNSFFSDIYTQRVNSTGHIQWAVNGIAICTANEFQRSPQIISNSSGGAIIVWKDSRNGDSDLYGQRVDPNGNILWTPNGKAICTHGHNQYTFNICSDNQGGIFVAWQNWESPLGRYGIYAQLVNSSGDIQWATNGETICYFSGFDGNRGIPEICIDGNGGAIITWTDTRGGNPEDIYIQRINSTGSIQWTSNGIAIVAAENSQSSVEICSDYDGGAIITWVDYRDFWLGDIYAQRINSTGDGLWTLNGVPVCMANRSQSNPQIYGDGLGGAIIVWEDNRAGIDFDIYAQGINSTGHIQWLAKEVTNGGDNESPSIPYGNYYIIIIAFSFLSLVCIKKKQISSKINP